MRHWHWWIVLAATGFFPCVGAWLVWKFRNAGPQCAEYLALPIVATPFFLAAIVGYAIWCGRKSAGAPAEHPERRDPA